MRSSHRVVCSDGKASIAVRRCIEGDKVRIPLYGGTLPPWMIGDRLLDALIAEYLGYPTKPLPNSLRQIAAGYSMTVRKFDLTR